MARRYLSGVQPSGLLHLGNYFGAIRSHIANQDNAFYFIADFHALTTIRDANELRQLTFDVARTYLALGLDPERAVIWRQSDVPEVQELAWLLATVTGMGLLERAHSYKDKVDRNIAPSVGLFYYPVLMAADILAFDSDVVPVGKDQVQHLEMTRDMAQSFNARYGDVFRMPKTELGVPEPVPGIDGAKMSKSYDNHIPIFPTSRKALKKRVMAIKTDSTPMEDPKDPDTCTVFELYALFADDDQKAAMRAKYAAGNYGYGHAKLELLELIEAHFSDAWARYVAYGEDPEQVNAVLRAGAAKARPVARAVLDRARAACGLA